MHISIVIPAYNEEQNIKEVFSSLAKILNGTDSVEYEIIFVDDGSTDRTYGEIKSLVCDHVKAIKLDKHSGKTFALKTGIDRARHPVIVTLDADLQNDPKDILPMLEHIRRGYDCVCGRRTNRSDGAVKFISSKFSNFIRRIILRDRFRDINCPLRVFNKECVKNVDFFEGAHRYLPLLILAEGHKIAEYPVAHLPRIHGQSKYGVGNRLWIGLTTLMRVKKHLKQNNINLARLPLDTISTVEATR